MEKREPSYTVGRDVSWYSHCRKMRKLLRKLKTEFPYEPTTSLLDINLEKRKTLIKKKCTSIFSAELFIITKI